MVHDTNHYTLESMAWTLADLAAALRDIGRANRLGAQVERPTMSDTLRDALEAMREFAEHSSDCIFAADLSGVNGDEWAGERARRCSCGFDKALTLYDAALTEAEG